MPFHPLTKSQAERFERQGISLLLRLGESINRLSSEMSFGNEEAKKEEIVNEARALLGKLIVFFEGDVHGKRSPLKLFLCIKPHSGKIYIPKAIIISIMAFRLVHQADNTILITTLMFLASTIDPENRPPLEIRRIVAVLAVEGLLNIIENPNTCGMVPFVSLYQKCAEVILGGEQCIPVIDDKTISILRAELDKKLAIPAKNPEPLNPVNPVKPASILSPQHIYEELRKQIIGQDLAARTVAIRGHLHLRRASLLATGKNVGRNECLLFVGSSSGCGKTMMALEASKIFKTKFTIYDSTQATSKGYQGGDIISDSIKSLICSAGNPKSIETFASVKNATLFFDEFTKKATRAANNNSGRDVSGYQVQVECLHIMSGGVVSLLGSHSSDIEFAQPEISTDGMLLIFAGLIDNFELALRTLKQKQRKSCLGFGEESVVKRGTYLYDLLLEYGLIPEFLNRLSAIIPFRQLDLNDFIKIATYPNGAIVHFNKMLEPQGLTISFTEGAIKEMAQFCLETAQARGLHMIIGGICEEAIFNQDTGSVEYDVAAVKRALDGMMAV